MRQGLLWVEKNFNGFVLPVRVLIVADLACPLGAAIS